MDDGGINLDRRGLATAGAWSWATASAAGILALVMGVVGLLVGAEGGQGDLWVYRGAWGLASTGGSLYDYVNVEGTGFIYPPFAAVLMAPSMALPPTVLGPAWSAASVALCFVLAGFLSSAQGRLWSTPGGLGVTSAFAGVMLASAPVLFHLECGQISLFVVVLAFADAAGLVPHRWRGVLVGLASAIKLTPLVFLAHYALTRQWRPLCRSSLTFALASLIGFLSYPKDSPVRWWRATIEGDFPTTAVAGNYSVLGLLARTMTDGVGRRAAWVFALAVIGVAAFWLAHRLHKSGKPVDAVLVIGCASLALSPLTWAHHQVWLVLAGLWLVTQPHPQERAWGVSCLSVTSVLFVPWAAHLVNLWAPAGKLVWEGPTIASLAVALSIPWVAAADLRTRRGSCPSQ